MHTLTHITHRLFAVAGEQPRRLALQFGLEALSNSALFPILTVNPDHFHFFFFAIKYFELGGENLGILWGAVGWRKWAERVIPAAQLQCLNCHGSTNNTFSPGFLVFHYLSLCISLWDMLALG